MLAEEITFSELQLVTSTFELDKIMKVFYVKSQDNESIKPFYATGVNMKQNTADRRQAILEIIREHGRARVEEMAREFSVSEVTIRNDLKFFEERGLVLRSHGGALLRDNVSFDHPLAEKQRIRINEKRKIAKAAAALIEDGDSIILDSGTTTSEIVQYLGDYSDLTILTNAVNIAYAAIALPKVQTILTGGFLRKKSFSLIGPDAEELLSKYYFDKLFLGVDGLDLEYGISTPNPEEASLNRIMVDISREVIVVADSTKFQHRSLSRICGLDRIHKLITDDDLDPQILSDLESMSLEVILAS